MVIQESDSFTGNIQGPAFTNNLFQFTVKIYQPLVNESVAKFDEYQSLIQNGTLLNRQKKIQPSLLDLNITS